MWYFSWILGLTLAVTVAILNAMWLELQETEERSHADQDEVVVPDRVGE